NDSFPATVHTLVPGQSVESLNLDVDIHQRMRRENTPMWHKWGPLPPEKAGLTLKVIQNMAKHDDLPSIVAFDTFVGNADRSRPNLFYDSATDHYFGIDMAASFCSELGKVA